MCENVNIEQLELHHITSARYTLCMICDLFGYRTDDSEDKAGDSTPSEDNVSHEKNSGNDIVEEEGNEPSALNTADESDYLVPTTSKNS